MARRVRAYIGLGANVGDAKQTLTAAVAALAALPGARVRGVSRLFRTRPVGVTDQPDFLNACLQVRTALGPEELLDASKAVERELGRAPGGVRHGPRPIDLDVLLLGDLEFSSERLTLPHSEVTSRRFVLEPLLEIDPDLALPDGTRLADELDGVRDQPVRPAGAL